MRGLRWTLEMTLLKKYKIVFENFIISPLIYLFSSFSILSPSSFSNYFLISTSSLNSFSKSISNSLWSLIEHDIKCFTTDENFI